MTHTHAERRSHSFHTNGSVSHADTATSTSTASISSTSTSMTSLFYFPPDRRLMKDEMRRFLPLPPTHHTLVIATHSSAQQGSAGRPGPLEWSWGGWVCGQGGCRTAVC